MGHRNTIFLLTVFLSTVFISPGSGLAAQKRGETMAFTLKSAAFKDGETIPKQYTCDGIDISPRLSWEWTPEGTRSFTIIMDDPDAPVGTWNHWILYDLPAETKGLAEGVSKEPTLPDGSKQGITSFKRPGYGGPCPPKGPAHRYFFTIYALDITTLGLGPKASKEEVEGKLKGHILGKAGVMGKYGR